MREHVRLLLADLAAVCVAGRPAPASELSAAYASAVHPGDEATALLDGRRLGAVGAAWCNGVLANVLDYDDGHRLTKGHPGAVVIPAALAAAQLADATAEELLLAVVVGYEIAIRAGVALHARDDGYHASGAWGGLGAAAAAARGSSAWTRPRSTRARPRRVPRADRAHHALRRQPAMTKDACAWGASVGVSSALMAAGGFTAVDAAFLDEDASDLGSVWRLEELYLKAYPCCRWSQGAIRAALEARGERAARAGRRRSGHDHDVRRRRRARARSCPRRPRRRSTTSSAGRDRPSPRATSRSPTSSARGTTTRCLRHGRTRGRDRCRAHGRVPRPAPHRGGDRAARRPAPRRRPAARPRASRAPTTGPRSSPRRSPSTSIPTATSPVRPMTLGAATPAELLALLCDPVVSPARA